jgi:hypothetical protein
MARPAARGFGRRPTRRGRSAYYAESFPLRADRIDEILRGLGDQLTGIYQAEVDAMAATARAIR